MLRSVYSVLKRIFVGRPLATTEQEHQRLTKRVALAVFSSDAISSTAYATEEILHVLVPLAALGAIGYLTPISLIVVALLAVVTFSYRQTIFAYPSGGGSYVVSRENLGTTPSLVAGASLLVDYTLTVAVSISAGVLAITSGVESLRDHKVALALVLLGVITLANLRGLKESGRIFAIPTYVYIFSLAALVGWGLWRSYFGDLSALPPNTEELEHFTKQGTLLGGVTMLALMRAFSSGAVALTGVEAISNGVPAFRRPESKNAAATLLWMSVILGGFFFLISLLAARLQPTLSEHESILSILGTAVFGHGSAMYVALQASTAAILTLAANTAYADFPRLASIIARDGFLPRQLFNRGDRLVFSNGVALLAGAAALLLVVFRGKTTALIPLYAVGVFLSFTLSQFGMVQHHRRIRDSGWQRGVLINGVGAAATGIVLSVVVVSKFSHGAWVPVVIIPAIVIMLQRVKRHYTRVSEHLKITEGWQPPRMNHTVVVLVGSVHKGVLSALAYARSLAPNHLVAVSIIAEDGDQEKIEQQWADYRIDVPLEIINSPYRELTRPVLSYIDDIDARWDNDVVTVVIPEFVVSHWWGHLLHNQSALLLKGRLLFRKGTVVTSVPYHLD